MKDHRVQTPSSNEQAEALKFEKLEQKKIGRSNQGQDTCTDNNAVDVDRSHWEQLGHKPIKYTSYQTFRRGFCPTGQNLSLGQEDLQSENTLPL